LLYVISPPVLGDNFFDELEKLLASGRAGMFQLRVKDGSAASLAPRCLAACRRHGVKFIVNDDIALAKSCGADGAHIGEDDGEIAAARAFLGEKAIIGASCYDDITRARRAEQSGAGYVSFGAFYPTRTKIAKTSPPLSILSEWKKHSALPCCAIGGINAQNIANIRRAGADMIAVVGAVWDASEPAALAAARLCEGAELIPGQATSPRAREAGIYAF